MFQGIFLNGFGITDHFPLTGTVIFFRHGTAAHDPEKIETIKEKKLCVLTIIYYFYCMFSCFFDYSFISLHCRNER